MFKQRLQTSSPEQKCCPHDAHADTRAAECSNRHTHRVKSRYATASTAQVKSNLSGDFYPHLTIVSPVAGSCRSSLFQRWTNAKLFLLWYYLGIPTVLRSLSNFLLQLISFTADYTLSSKYSGCRCRLNQMHSFYCFLSFSRENDGCRGKHSCLKMFSSNGNRLLKLLTELSC